MFFLSRQTVPPPGPRTPVRSSRWPAASSCSARRSTLFGGGHRGPQSARRRPDRRGAPCSSTTWRRWSASCPGVAVFMAVFVVASTFGFVVAARQRELGPAAPGRRDAAPGAPVGAGGSRRVVAVLATLAGLVLAPSRRDAGSSCAVLREPWPARRFGAAEVPPPWIAWTWPPPAAASPGSPCSVRGGPRSGPRGSSRSRRCARRGWSGRRPERRADRRRRPVPGRGAAALFVDRLRRGRSAHRDGLRGSWSREIVVVGLVCFGRLLFPWLGGLPGAAPFARARRRRPAGPRARPHRGARALRGPGRADPRDLGDRRLHDGDPQPRRRLDHRPGPGAAAGPRSWSRPAATGRWPKPRLTTESRRGRHSPTRGGAGGRQSSTRGGRRTTGPRAVARAPRRTRGAWTSWVTTRIAVTETYASDPGAGLGDRVGLRVDGERVRAECRGGRRRCAGPVRRGARAPGPRWGRGRGTDRARLWSSSIPRAAPTSEALLAGT